MAKGKPNEIRIIRMYEAPVKAVWDAWTDPKQTAKWWGPRGFTLTTHSKDLRVGGSWAYTMHGPDGTNYENKTIYFEVDQYKKLVYDHGGNDDRPPLFRVTVLFQEIKGKTKMDMTMALATTEAAVETRKFVKAAKGNSTWDRLAEYVEKMASGKEIFVIHESFSASIEKVFEMWTNPKHLSKWLPPTGMHMNFIKSEIKEGSRTFYSMEGNGIKMFGSTEYLKIERPHLLVYTQQFRDEQDKISRHPLAPLWPETMQTTVQFESEGPEETRVTVTWAPHGHATPEEIAAFVKERGGMTTGWSGSFDKLEEQLKS